ncbi:MAG: ABC transporter substrate-binding protein [Betaproteobacteria bacterium]
MSVISVVTRSIVLGVAIGAALLSPPVSADQPPTIMRIGVLGPLGGIGEEGLLEGLGELGYVEGRNLIIESRRYTQSTDSLQSAAADLVRSRVDVIVALGTQAARAALSATATIPVVFQSGDPVAAGLVASLARPGANATGVSNQTTDLMGKRLELLKKIAPRIRRVIFLVNPESPLHTPILSETQIAARTLRIQLVTLDAPNAEELDAALRGIRHRPGDAFVVSSDSFFIANKTKIADAIRKAKLPALVPTRDYHGEGVLMSYGPSLRWGARRAAAYVDKILKGARPADLPVEQYLKFELFIDLRAAHELGLKVPQELILRADEVIR